MIRNSRRASNTARSLRSHSSAFAGVLLLGALILPLLGAQVAMAGTGDFSVQIGAFREAPAGFTEKAEKVGQLYTSKSPHGLTRYQVGRFDELAAAEAAKRALRGAGYADAFVVHKNVAPSQRYETTTRSSNEFVETVSTRSTMNAADSLAGVPDDLRDRVVLLDGRPHVKEGNQFIPLSRYLSEYR